VKKLLRPLIPVQKVTMDQINNEVKESTKESSSVVPPKIPGHVNNKTD